jgi:ABC-type molybdenum transport system ATPase subunit/photorepair protein PhrA
MIARAIVNRPGLLVIDGTLDGLNNEAAAELLDMIRAKCACTVVVLTGRVEIASSCETILELPAP